MAFSPGPGAALVTEPEPGIPENQNIVTLPLTGYLAAEAEQ